MNGCMDWFLGSDEDLFYGNVRRKFFSTVCNEKRRRVSDRGEPRMKCKFSYFLFFLAKKKVFMNNLSLCPYLFSLMRDIMMLLGVINRNNSLSKRDKSIKMQR